MQDYNFYRDKVKKKRITRFFKRIFDISAAFIGIAVFLPLFLVVAILISSESKGGVFYRQVRIGKDGKPFRIMKFRTMVADADKKGLAITVGADSRITKTGKFLRASKIDELPQLFNVFVGQMSFVGPRPEVKKYVDMYDETQKAVLLVRPGITEYASIVYCEENALLQDSVDPEATYINEIMPRKLEMNLNYIKSFSFIGDIGIIIKTFCAILK
ncbi:sugar transferase [bacterium]|nr:sugar transferase [bacterium]